VGTAIKISNTDFMQARIGAFDIRNIRRVDPVFVLITAALIVFGLLVLLSATHSGSVQSGSLASQIFSLMLSANFIKQLVGIAVGSMLAILLISLDYRSIVAWAPLLYAAAIVLLVLVLLIGTEAKGGKRWIDIGPVNFQPSEFAKLSLIYMMAWYFSLVGPRIKQLPFFLLAFVIPAVPAVLILKQPNLGTTMTLFPIMFVMLFVAGCRFWHIALLVILGLIATPVAFSQLKDYQKERVLSFVGVSKDEAETSNYQKTLKTLIKTDEKKDPAVAAAPDTKTATPVTTRSRP
jgi:rod shape determining protein RodA